MSTTSRSAASSVLADRRVSSTDSGSDGFGLNFGPCACRAGLRPDAEHQGPLQLTEVKVSRQPVLNPVVLHLPQCSGTVSVRVCVSFTQSAGATRIVAEVVIGEPRMEDGTRTVSSTRKAGSVEVPPPLQFRAMEDRPVGVDERVDLLRDQGGAHSKNR